MEVTETQVRQAMDLLRLYRERRDRFADAEVGTPNWIMWCCYDSRVDAMEDTLWTLGIEAD